MAGGESLPNNAVVRMVVEPAAEDPNRDAVVDAVTGDAHTRADILAGVRAAAATLVARGVQPEQRVILCCADTPAFLHWFWGAMWMGAVPVPVSTMLTADDYRFLLDDSRAVGLVYSAPFEATAGPLGAAADRPFLQWWLDDEDVGALSDGDEAPDVYPATDDDVAFWLYTSGTTGFPKGAMHRHIDMGAATDLYAVPVLGMGPSDVVYSVAKLFFAYGLGNAGYFPAATGARVVLHAGRPTPHDVADHVVAHRPTLFFGVPTFYGQLLASDIADDTFSSVRLAVSAGEPLPADIHRRFGERFGVEILDGLGTTELVHIAISNLPGRSIPGSSGFVLDGYEISLRDDSGLEVPDGTPGALHVAGETVTIGYWNRTDRTRQALQGRFLATGDSYVRETDGSLTCLGRTDDMLKVGGIWVSPAEVEGCIIEMDSVLQAAVVGAEDDDGLVKPKAFVVPVDGADLDGLAAAVQDHVRQRLAPYKYPRWVDIVAELPQTATGKIKRYMLRT